MANANKLPAKQTGITRTAYKGARVIAGQSPRTPDHLRGKTCDEMLVQNRFPEGGYDPYTLKGSDGRHMTSSASVFGFAIEHTKPTPTYQIFRNDGTSIAIQVIRTPNQPCPPPPRTN